MRIAFFVWSGWLLLACQQAMPQDPALGDASDAANTGASVADAAQPSTDAMATDETDAGTPRSDCFDPANVRTLCHEFGYASRPEHTPPLVLPEAQPFIRASDLAPDARFSRVGGFAALAVRGAGAEPLVVHYASSWAAPGTTSKVLPIALDASTQGFTAVDVVGAEYELGTGVDVVALLCRDDACALFGANVATDTALTALPGGAIPSGLVARGLSHHLSERACVYGDGGYACFDGRTWSERQLAGARLRMLDTLGLWWAVGEQGALFRGYGQEQPLAPIDTGTTETLVWAAVTDACWSATTESGRLLDGCDDVEPLLCDGASLPPAFEYSAGVGPRNALLVDATGTPYRRSLRLVSEGALWCAMPTLSDPNVLEASHARCGIIDNWLLLTQDALYVAGFDDLFCAIE